VTTPDQTASRQSPKRGRVPVSELTMIVRVPGDPAAVQAFTADEHVAAHDYARQTGGTVDQLAE